MKNQVLYFFQKNFDHSGPLFLFCLFNTVCNAVDMQFIKLLMTGFELWISGVGSDHSTNCATTISFKTIILL